MRRRSPIGGGGADPSGMPWLAGDIGGTNARFARAGGRGYGPISRFATRDFPGPLAAIRAFLDGCEGTPDLAALAWAGPVTGATARLTNADWKIDLVRLAADSGIGEIVLVNDFAAIAWALPALGSDDLVAVGGGRAVPGAPMAVLGPGTGLGVAAWLPAAGGGRVVCGEGGHASLPACTDDEDRMLARFRAEYGHVSAERLLCGDGIVRLYDWFNAEAGNAAPPRGAAEITATAADCPVCRQALDAFCNMLGTVAGDLALTFGARGGVFVAGGIVPRMRGFLAASRFRARFEAKGRFADYMKAIPTFVVLHPDPAFLGLTRLLASREA